MTTTANPTATIFTNNHKDVFAALDRGESFGVVCPDGVKRELWGHCPTTGALFIDGWTGDVWCHCRGESFGVEFE